METGTLCIAATFVAPMAQKVIVNGTFGYSIESCGNEQRDISNLWNNHRKTGIVMANFDCCIRLAVVLKRNETDINISNEYCKQQHQTVEVGSANALNLP